MLTRAAERVTQHARRMVQLEAELAALEVKGKLSTLGVGVGLFVAAALFGFFAIAFLLAAAAAGLATFLPVWGAILVVAGGLILLTAGLVVGGRALLRRSTPPLPELALREAELTKEALRNGSD